MIMRLDLERDCMTVTDLDYARVLTGTLQHPWRLGRQCAEQGLRILVTAVLRPQGAEYAELRIRRLATECLEDQGVLALADPVICDECGRNRRISRTRVRRATHRLLRAVRHRGVAAH